MVLNVVANFGEGVHVFEGLTRIFLCLSHLIFTLNQQLEWIKHSGLVGSPLEVGSKENVFTRFSTTGSKIFLFLSQIADQSKNRQ